MPSVASSTSAVAGSDTDRSVIAPAGLVVGDLCLIIGSTDGAGGDLGLSGTGAWTKLSVAPAAVPGVHAFVATDVSAADGPWTLTGASGEWVHRMAVRITDPGDVTFSDAYNGTPGMTPPDWNAAVVPSADASVDGTLDVIVGYSSNGWAALAGTTLIEAPGALAAVYQIVDEGPTGTITWQPVNAWSPASAIQILIAPPGGEDPTPIGEADGVAEAHSSVAGARPSEGVGAGHAEALGEVVGSRSSRGGAGAVAEAVADGGGARPSSGEVAGAAHAHMSAHGARTSSGEAQGVAAALGAAAGASSTPTGAAVGVAVAEAFGSGTRPSIGSAVGTAHAVGSWSGPGTTIEPEPCRTITVGGDRRIIVVEHASRTIVVSAENRRTAVECEAERC